jgi:phosphoglycolate phosphatase
MKKLDYDYILFDLDGTLTDSVEGIINAVKYACAKLGIRIPEQDELMEFIGPPMVNSFDSHFGLKGEQLNKAIDFYHIYYKEKGWSENKVYPGVLDMLKELKNKGKHLAMCTNKTFFYAEWIAKLFEFDKYLDFVGGSDPDVGRTEKYMVIDYTLNKLGADKSRAIMIGDRHYDVEGASKVGIKTIGVTYGYGSREELEKCGAFIVVDSAKEISDLF